MGKIRERFIDILYFLLFIIYFSNIRKLEKKKVRKLEKKHQERSTVED
jgi:hypothetical protein